MPAAVISPIDPILLTKLRVVVARFGEMDGAGRWNTRSILGRIGKAGLTRGFPATHFFAQARVALLGARNQSWLREITTTLSGRFGHGDAIEPLVILAKAQYPLERWRYCLLWHFGSTDGLYRRFAEEFLFPHLQESIVAFDTEAVLPFIKRIEREKQIEPLSDYGRRRAARDLLRMAAAFGLVAGRRVRRFTNVPIPGDALLYALYDLMDRFSSASRAVHSRRWRLFLMKPEEVEHELFNLHQFRRLRYELAGSVRELALPHENLLEFTKSLAA